MARRGIDPFFKTLGKHLGVAPGEIQLKGAKVSGEITCVGPKPRASRQIPDLPTLDPYCFTFVLNIEPPRGLCNAYRQEYAELTAQLPALIAAEAWDSVLTVVNRLSELATAIANTCFLRREKRVITYCLFPGYFHDPFAGGRTLPPEPPIPPLMHSR